MNENQIDPNKIMHLSMPAQVVNIVMEALHELPAKVSLRVIQDIHSQINAQIASELEASKAEKDDKAPE